MHATVMAGPTTIQSVTRWQIPGPRILTSSTQISNRNLTPDSPRAIVRGINARGADLIKLFASAGLQNGGAQTLSDAQLGAICGDAKAQGLRTVVHAISAGSVRAATLAGCTEIEHGTFATDAEHKLMAEHGTIFDPQVCGHPDNGGHPIASVIPRTAVIPGTAVIPRTAVIPLTAVILRERSDRGIAIPQAVELP